MSMARFNRTRLIEHLQAKADRQQQEHGFDQSNGTAQLRPRPRSTEHDALIARAVAYGRWRATQNFATDLQDGRDGT
jgi:hypothetical protein